LIHRGCPWGRACIFELLSIYQLFRDIPLRVLRVRVCVFYVILRVRVRVLRVLRVACVCPTCFACPTCVPDLLRVACQIGSLLLSYEVRVGDPELKNYKLNHCLRTILDLLAAIHKY